MLKFDSDFCSDEKASSIIKRHINDRLIHMMDVELGLFCEGGYDAIDEYDPEFIAYALNYVPLNCPDEKAAPTVLGLYALLKAEDEFIPQLVMEYALNVVIRTHIRYLEENGESTVFAIPEPERSYVLDKIKEDCLDSDEPEEDVIMVMEMIEDVTYYPETCFWDADYQFLDDYSEEELLESGLNEYMGIMDKPTNTFVIKPEWLKGDKDNNAGAKG